MAACLLHVLAASNRDRGSVGLLRIEEPSAEMIPLKLRLRNFMCYREDVPPLDFRGIHLACLAGDNGHGKSALLDAITWALWGRSRAPNDDALIHTGQTEMEVELEFELEGSRYRVIRKRRAGDARRSGQTALELQGWTGEQYRSLSEPTVRGTEARLRQLLRLDYDTFINSAFLVQGRADEFTTKRPGERKQVLADILGLEVYDRYEERARARARACADRADMLAIEVQQYDEEISRRPLYEEQEREAARQVADLSEKLRAAERTLEDLRTRQRELLGYRREVEGLTQRLQREEAEAKRLAAQLAEGRERLEALQAILSEQAAIEQGHRAWQEAQAAVQSWSQRQLEAAQIRAERERAEGEIRSAQAALQAELRAAEARAQQLRDQAARADVLRQTVAQARERLTALEAVRQEESALRARQAELIDAIAGLRASNGALKAEMEALREKIALLEPAGARCPVCQQPLTDADRERLLAEWEEEGKGKGVQFRSNSQQAKKLEEERRQVEDRLAACERELKEEARWQRQLAQAEQALAEAERALDAAVEAEAAVEQLRARLERGEYAQAERALREQLAQREQAIGYDATEHARAVAAVADNAGWAQRYADLQRALASIDAERRAVEQLIERQEALAASLADTRARRDELQERLSELPQIEARVLEQDRLTLALSEQEGEARQRLGAAQQRVAACEQAVARRAQRAQELEQTRLEQAIYEELREAFGKRGLQAMIIEAAVPEIEDEANRLLERMSDGRMTIALETQRDTKKGDAIETLDVVIRDELGVRPYEMLSGGEALRVNFGLRIALSRLLARRAGTRLQTLFIDEGFGSQDAQGRLRLVEAIQSIQDEFACILVITHIEELKDLFPVRIDVVKTAEGTRIHLN